MSQELIDILIAVVKAIVIMVGVVAVAAFLSFVERRLLAWWQDRWGPNRVGPFGLLQLPADMLKMFFKEDWTPPFVDKLTFTIAPLIAMAGLLMAFAIVPIVPGWGVAPDLNIGILFFLAMAGLSVYAVLFAGWSSNSKYALLGGVRSAAQTLSYEVFMGLAVMGVVLQTGSFSMSDIVAAQSHCWFIFPQILGFLTFVLGGVAVTHRTPFDLPEAESELAAGYHTEYSGMKWGMFFVGEYVGVVMVSSLLVALFFGGSLPFFGLGFIPPIINFLIKVAFFIMLFVLVRAALPRPRYDQMMSAAWKVCLPLALLNLAITGAIVVWQSSLAHGS